MADPPIVKACNKCQEPKPLEEFSRKKNTPDGRNQWCRSCMTASAVRWAKDNPEKSREHHRNYDRANADDKRDYRDE